MSGITEIIDSLESRIEKLFMKINRLEQDSILMQDELKNAENVIQNQKKEIDLMQSQIETLKMANSLLGGEENKRDTKLKINSLIREIDYCITQLSD
jgi:chromosome segregation ATPase